MLPGLTSRWLTGHGAEVVGSVQPTGGVGGDAHGVGHGQWLAAAHAVGDHLGQRLSRQVLHGDEVRLVDVAEIVNVDNVLVFEKRGNPCFLQQHLDEAALAGEVIVDLFDHHQLLEAHRAALAGQKNLGHAAGAQTVDEIVATEAFENARLSFIARSRCGLAHEST